MGLIIEVSFDIGKNANVTSIKQLLSNLAEKHNSQTNYFIHEIEGHSTTINRNDCINIVEFDSINKINIIRYVKEIIKIRFIKIDCIYEEDGVVSLIYSGGNSRFAYPHTPSDCKRNCTKPINGRHSHTSKNNILELVKLWGTQ